MGMRRNQFLGGIGKCMCFLVVCVMTFSSCYNDDDLKNSISGLEDRMDKLEASLQSVQTDISLYLKINQSLLYWRMKTEVIQLSFQIRQK